MTRTKVLQWIWSLLRYQPLTLVIVTTIPFFVFGGNLLAGLLQQAFFNYLDQATVSNQVHLSLTMWVILLQLLVISVVQFILRYINFVSFNDATFIIITLLQRNLLEYLLKRPGARAVAESHGAIMVRFRDDPPLMIDFLSHISIIASQAVFSIFAFIILFRVNALITSIVVIPLGVVILIAQLLKGRLVRYRKDSLEAESKLTGMLGEIMGAVQAVQIASAEQSVLAHIATLARRRRAAGVKDTTMSSILDTVYANTMSIGVGLILIIVALSTHQKFFRAGDLALFTAYMGMIATFIQSVGIVLSRFVQTGVSFERIEALLQGGSAASLIKRHPLYLRGPEPPALVVANKKEEDRFERLEAVGLTYQFLDTGRGIENIHINIERGSLTVVTGRVGSGKTTLVRTLLGHLKMDSGEIQWNGKAIDEPRDFFVPPRVAYTSQVPHLFSMTLKENILLGLPEDLVDLSSAVHTAVMEYDISLLENGIDTFTGTHGVKLSGGQIQRAAAARMFVRNAELLVFDDLSSALDVKTEHTLWERLFSHNKYTCLAVSHRRSVLQRADHILLLKDGKVEAEGNLAYLLKTSQEMRRLWSTDIETAEEQSK